MEFVYDIGYGIGTMFAWFRDNPWAISILGVASLIMLKISYPNKKEKDEDT